MNDLPQDERKLIDAMVDGTNVYGDSDVLANFLRSQPIEIRAVLFSYWDMRQKGASPKLAEMLVLQSPPMSNSDREFLHGHCNGNQFGKGPLSNDLGDRMKTVAEAEGQSINGKVYIGGLARYPGDPQAWVSDRGDVKRVIESRPGWKCSGSVEVGSDSRMDDIQATKPSGRVPFTGGLSNDDV